MPSAEAQPGDDPKMIDAIRTLAAVGIDVRRPVNNDHQLKVNPSTSYYPGRGTIVIDGEPGALRQRGLGALLAILDVEPGTMPRNAP